MNASKKQFIVTRIKDRQYLLNKIIDSFKETNPYSIHLFGSGAQGFKDEFSDIDVWITYKDEDIKNILQSLCNVFKNVSPILIRHHSKSWSPVGGSSNSIIHELNGNLFVVDYYISKLSQTTLMKDSKILYGNNNLPSGKWKLNHHIYKNPKDSHTLRKDIDLLLDLIFISVKGIIRKWDNDYFVNNLKKVHSSFRKRYYGKLKSRHIKLNFPTNYNLLSDIYKISNKRQKKSIFKIRKYFHQVERLYLNS